MAALSTYPSIPLTKYIKTTIVYKIESIYRTEWVVQQKKVELLLPFLAIPTQAALTSARQHTPPATHRLYKNRPLSSDLNEIFTGATHEARTKK